MKMGASFVFGCPDRRPIINLPPGCQVRVRQRKHEFVRVWVRTANSIENWYVRDTSAGWELVARIGANFRQIKEIMHGSRSSVATHIQ